MTSSPKPGIRFLRLSPFEIFTSWTAAVVVVLMVSLALTGCSHIVKRAQSPDLEGIEFDENLNPVTYVGDVAGPAGLEKMQIDGVALVTQLRGTGSEPGPSWQRDRLIEEIKRHEVEGINDLLASKDNSLVIITGEVPPGARKGDRYDVVVKTIGGSDTSSLEGGFLMQARMTQLVRTRSRVRKGHDSGFARGRVVIDEYFEADEEGKNQVRGLVPGGGVVARDRACGIRIVSSEKSVRLATSIARAINARFSTHIQGRSEGVAKAVNDSFIEVIVPEDYRHNVGRFFHVLLNLAIDESPENRVNRIEHLERQLYNPEKAKIAGVRLEAIGKDAISFLKRALRNPEQRVRFEAAQALAYMQEAAGAETLAEMADIEPAFRWHALTALVSLKNSASEQALQSLFDSASVEARYGAFRALRESIPESPFVEGEMLAKEFFLHTVSSKASPVVHISRSRRPEIVLFGADQEFNNRLLFVQSGLTVKSNGPSRVLVKRYLPDGQEQKTECTALITDVIRNLVRAGGDYGDVISLLMDARQSGAIESQLVVNAVPQLRNRATVSNFAGEESEKYVSEDVPILFDDSTVEGLDDREKQKSKGLFKKFW